VNSNISWKSPHHWDRKALAKRVSCLTSGPILNGVRSPPSTSPPYSRPPQNTDLGCIGISLPSLSRRSSEGIGVKMKISLCGLARAVA
jgi:hypothetical protein